MRQLEQGMILYHGSYCIVAHRKSDVFLDMILNG